MAKQLMSNWPKGYLIWAGAFVASFVALRYVPQLELLPYVVGLLWIIVTYIQSKVDTLATMVGTANVLSFERSMERLSQPIEPFHDAPAPIAVGDDGASERTVAFHAHFRDFASIFNDLIEGTRWRVQEASTSPDYCPRHSRRYNLFYGQTHAGRVWISDGYGYSLEQPNVVSSTTVWDARSYPASDILVFHDHLASLVAGGSTLERSHRRIRNAMLETVWQVGPTTIVAPKTLAVSLEGDAKWYLQRAGLVEYEETGLPTCSMNSKEACPPTLG